MFQERLGFPSFYGENMDAWIDCTVTVRPGQLLILEVDEPFEFKARCPEQYDALFEGAAFVNFRRAEIGRTPVIAILLTGRRR